LLQKAPFFHQHVPLHDSLRAATLSVTAVFQSSPTLLQRLGFVFSEGEKRRDLEN